MRRRVAIIGSFSDSLNGQTIKTKTLYDELSIATDWRLVKVDTQFKKKNPCKLAIQYVYGIVTCKDIFLLASRKGMALFFPLLYYASKVAGKKIFHDVIGGNLAEYVKKYPKYKKYLNSFTANMVESRKMAVELEGLGVFNSVVVPNFKRLKIANPEKLCSHSEPYTFCTFSRVMKEKGISDAANAVAKTNEKYGRTVCTLDIYGMIDPSYESELKGLLADNPEIIKYCGTVSYSESTDTIQKYYALLFPTHWKGEGFPGTLIDAFAAGLPVIATDWNVNSEIVKNGKTGIVYPNAEIRSLQEAIEWMIENQESVYQMKINCLSEANRYLPEEHINKIVGIVLKGTK